MQYYDLNLLRTLDALLTAGSVTAAAEQLHLSVPATSHALARLREVMGDALLVRAGRRLTPTPRALAMKTTVARLLADAQALAAVPAPHELTTVERNFVIRAPEGIAVAYGATLAMEMRREMPRSSLHFVPEAQGDRSALREGRIDLDIGSFRSRDPEVEVAELSRQTQVGAVQSGHPLANGTPSAARYAAEAHVAVARRPGEPSPVDDALAALSLHRRVALSVPSSYAALVIAARSPLVATATERIARVMAPGLGLTVFALPFELAPEVMLMAWHPRQSAEPAHRWLREVLQRVLKAEPGPLPAKHMRGPDAAAGPNGPPPRRGVAGTGHAPPRGSIK